MAQGCLRATGTTRKLAEKGNDLGIFIKGKGQPPQNPGATPAHNPVGEAYVRLSQRKGPGRAAAAVGEAIDSVVADEELLSEEEAARELADDVTRDLPAAPPLQQAEVIAERLKQKIEASRGKRGQVAQEIKKILDSAE